MQEYLLLSSMIMVIAFTTNFLCACIRAFLAHLVTIVAFGLPLGALLTVHKVTFFLAASLRCLLEGCKLLASRSALWLHFLVAGVSEDLCGLVLRTICNTRFIIHVNP